MKEALREAYAVAPADELIIATLEIRHPTFLGEDGLPDSAWVTTNEVDIQAGIEADAPVRGGETVTFRAMAFRFKLAPIEPTAKTELQLQIDNVSRLLVEQLDRAATDWRPVEMCFRPYLESDLAEPQMLPPPTYTLSKVKVDRLTARATARVDMDFGGAFPRRVYTASEFPALIGA